MSYDESSFQTYEAHGCGCESCIDVFWCFECEELYEDCQCSLEEIKIKQRKSNNEMP
jgi:hypothetical protein